MLFLLSFHPFESDCKITNNSLYGKIFFLFCRLTRVMQNDKILEINQLCVSFDGRKVVEGVSYSLQRGRTLGIVGESGSGKSVSTLALMGLLPKNATVEGEAWLSANGDSQDGAGTLSRTNLLTLDDKQMRQIRGQRIAMIFQEPMTSLNPVQRCGEQVVEMLRLHEEVDCETARNRTIELFKEVLLPRPEKIFDSYPHEISGGQKQRVMIAMALICNPDIVIADEPTTALDVTVQKTILELLRQLQQKHGISIVFITHDLGVIAQIADDIAVMYQGRIVEQGAPGQTLHSPQHPYTQDSTAVRKDCPQCPTLWKAALEQKSRQNVPDTRCRRTRHRCSPSAT